MIEHWRLRLAIAPVEEPVTLDEAKAQLRVDHTDEDPLIDSYIVAARTQAELVGRRAILTQTYDLILDAWPQENVIELPQPPVQSVTSITYIDADDVTRTMPASDYSLDADSEPGRLFLKAGKSWPGGTLRPLGGIKIRYVAGYADVASVPQMIKQAILLGVSHYYENRGDAGGVLPDVAVSLLLMDRGSW